jgi:hypothetical protein
MTPISLCVEDSLKLIEESYRNDPREILQQFRNSTEECQIADKWEEYRREKEQYVCESCMFADPKYVNVTALASSFWITMLTPDFIRYEIDAINENGVR